MMGAIVSFALGGLGRGALRFAIGLALAVVIGIAFTVASVVVMIETLLGAAAGPSLIPAPVVVAPGSSSSAAVVALARAQIGTPYVWGGASPGGFDCSGLVQWAYAQVGVSLPRTAQEQYDATGRLDPTQLQPGDLVFFSGTDPNDPSFITHVGIYIGGGQMINAPDVGEAVSVMPVFSGYWGAHFAGAGRVGT